MSKMIYQYLYEEHYQLNILHQIKWLQIQKICIAYIKLWWLLSRWSLQGSIIHLHIFHEFIILLPFFLWLQLQNEVVAFEIPLFAPYTVITFVQWLYQPQLSDLHSPPPHPTPTPIIWSYEMTTMYHITMYLFDAFLTTS